MTSRFRNNWPSREPQQGPENFDAIPCRDRSISDEFTADYRTIIADSSGGDMREKRSNNGDRIIFHDRHHAIVDNRNGKLRDRSIGGPSRWDNELEEDREIGERCYHRGRSCRDQDFRSDAAECKREERRAPIGMKGAIGSAIGRHDLGKSLANDEATLEARLASSMTSSSNGNSSKEPSLKNGASKQVKRIEPRDDYHGTIGSLTPRERLGNAVIIGKNSQERSPTDRSHWVEESAGGSRDIRLSRSVRTVGLVESHLTMETGTPTGRNRKEIDDYGSINSSRSIGGQRGDDSYSPVDRMPNGSNGNSWNIHLEQQAGENSRSDEGGLVYLTERRRYDDEEDFQSMDRRTRRNAEGRSCSPRDETEDRNGNCDSLRDEDHKEKRSSDKVVGPGGSRNRCQVEINRFYDENSNANGLSGERINGKNGENGGVKKSFEEENSHGVKSIFGKKSRGKPSPEDFDVEIHRYERAALRRDADLGRKNSLKARDSGIPRKNSFDEHQKSRGFDSSKRSNEKSRDGEFLRKELVDDRDEERQSRKSSFKNRDESLRKSPQSNRFLVDIRSNNSDADHGLNNNHENGRKNGSYRHRDRSESSKRDRNLSDAIRIFCSDDDDEDVNQDDEDHFRRNDRHSRPLMPPRISNSKNSEDKIVNLETRDESSNRRRSKLSTVHNDRKKDPQDLEDLARNYVEDFDVCRGKIGDETTDKSVLQNRDRSSSARRVVSKRSLHDSRSDHFSARKIGQIGVHESALSQDDLIVNDKVLGDDCEDRADFSTIEKNGTTVIRIRRNSGSPVGRSRRHEVDYRETVETSRYRNYDEDEAEDEEEEDEIFQPRNQQNDYKRRLWSKRAGGVQITDLEDGQPCLDCGDTCPGFSAHSWRKNCTSCKCPREAHDVCHEEWVSVRARLGLKGEGPTNYVGFDPRDQGLTWAPPGLSPSKVEEYFSMLPEISVPRIGTPGDRHRDRQLSSQLPKQDLATAYCRHLDSQHSSSADDFMAARNEIALDIGTVKEILERGHECGVCHEPLKYGSLVVTASKLGLSYHPSCFQCTQCRELLVDLAYCVHDDALYCERHYAEQLKPRCAACDELIFSGEYTKAMNKDWHSGHFCCWQCDESLTGQRYVLRDEHPYCIKCYESVFANGCEECSKIIGIDSKDLSYKDKHWHEACFLCNKCRVSLVDKQFGSKVDKIYCGNCYDAQFASRCDGCGEIFRAGTKKMEYKTRQWHEKCFCCVVCKNPIGTKSFIPREQEIYCAGCYEDKFATRCVKCNKIITSGGVTYKNEPWHRDCFTCSHCNNSLAGQRFTSRDDKPYCAECFGELFAKRCTACTKPITGIGGTRFISFEDRHWHNNCFICAGCNSSLVGRGFITDGDDIICPECAKQKLTE